VQGRALGPGDLAVEGLADEVVAEGEPAAGVVLDDAATQRCVGPVLESSDRACEARVEAPAHGGRGGQRGARVVVEARGSEEDCVADVLGQWQLVAVAELEPAGPRAQPVLGGEDGAELLDEERQPRGSRLDGSQQRGRDVAAQNRLQQCAGRCGIERLDRQLVEAALPAQLAAQAAQRMATRHLVAAVRRDDEERLGLERRREDASMSSVPSSAHCRSSRKTAAGPFRAAAAKVATTRSQSAARSRSPAPPSSGSAAVSGQLAGAPPCRPAP
jgi:hypothetical protein